MSWMGPSRWSSPPPPGSFAGAQVDVRGIERWTSIRPRSRWLRRSSRRTSCLRAESEVQVPFGRALQVIETVAVMQALELRSKRKIEGRPEAGRRRTACFSGQPADPEVHAVEGLFFFGPAGGRIGGTLKRGIRQQRRGPRPASADKRSGRGDCRMDGAVPAAMKLVSDFMVLQVLPEEKPSRCRGALRAEGRAEAGEERPEHFVWGGGMALTAAAARYDPPGRGRAARAGRGVWRDQSTWTNSSSFGWRTFAGSGRARSRRRPCRAVSDRRAPPSLYATRVEKTPVSRAYVVRAPLPLRPGHDFRAASNGPGDKTVCRELCADSRRDRSSQPAEDGLISVDSVRSILRKTRGAGTPFRCPGAGRPEQALGRSPGPGSGLWGYCPGDALRRRQDAVGGGRRTAGHSQPGKWSPSRPFLCR